MGKGESGEVVMGGERGGEVANRERDREGRRWGLRISIHLNGALVHI